MKNDNEFLMIRMSVQSTGKRLTCWDAERIERNRIGRENISQVGLIAFSLSLRTEIDGDTLYVLLYRRLASSQEVWHVH